MAQDGDTITYTFSGGSSVAEDVSNVDKATVKFCDGGGGESSASGTGGAGGRVENSTIDVSNQNTLYIWVGGPSGGRYYYNTAPTSVRGSGSTEISFSSAGGGGGGNPPDPDEPFLVGAGGGGSSAFEPQSGFISEGNDGLRSGDEDAGNGDPQVPPPQGGAAGTPFSPDGEDGEGAIDDQNRGLVSGGTTITGGGSGADTDGEVQISFSAGPQPPSAPTNLSVTLQ
jgi:hypothetical protein